MYYIKHRNRKEMISEIYNLVNKGTIEESNTNTKNLNVEDDHIVP